MLIKITSCSLKSLSARSTSNFLAIRNLTAMFQYLTSLFGQFLDFKNSSIALNYNYFTKIIFYKNYLKKIKKLIKLIICN